jgi:hypothetical protein
MNEFFTGLLGNAVYDILKVAIMAAITIGLSRLNSKYPTWGSHLRYGLTTFALLAVLLFSFTGHAVFYTPPTPPAQVTPENIESYVHQWIDHLGLGYTNILGDPTENFGLLVQVQDIGSVVISRPKSPWDNYILIIGNLDPSPAQLTVLQKMPQAQIVRLNDTISLEMARTGVAYRPIPPFRAHFEKRIPITPDMTEYSFANALEEVENAQVLVANLRALQLGQQ